MAANTAVLRRGVEVTISGLSTESLNNQRAWVVTACTDTPTGQRHGVWLGPGHPPMRIRRVNLTPVVLGDWPDKLEVFITEHSAKVVKKLFSDHLEKPFQAVLAMHENAADFGKQLRSETQTVPLWLSSRVEKLLEDVSSCYFKHDNGFDKCIPAVLNQMQQFESKFATKAGIAFVFSSIDQIRQGCMDILHTSDKIYQCMEDVMTIREAKDLEKYMPARNASSLTEAIPEDYICIRVMMVLCMEDLQVTQLQDNYWCASMVHVPPEKELKYENPDEQYLWSCMRGLDATLSTLIKEETQARHDEMSDLFAHLRSTNQFLTSVDSKLLKVMFGDDLSQYGEAGECYRMEGGFCGWCFKSNGVQHMNKCGGCQVGLYCCRQHQKDHWPVHKKYCDRLKTLKATQEDVLHQKQGIKGLLMDIRNRTKNFHRVMRDLKNLTGEERCRELERMMRHVS
jgi:hypothetical protein